ncbi:uncharacterized protein LOC119490588 [Sebastes umbrosus]|uniref:uncharacterized protein LOC119490588 n=1 Tax=Sebastes umbrosus TaxID=72105 RepID=UPI00189D9292|nr:uncharacterized protein LOC119490588 [Sebastes umbrosus]
MKILPSQSVCRAQRDMASALYSQDLTCPICRTIFTDPVNLLCGHSFCRECITDVLSSQHRCPECDTAVPTEGECLLTIHILKSLAEKAKEAEQVKKEKEKAEAAELCLEHEEKLKLFCVTDQQLACIICRDGERHEGHKFKPIKEAAASLRQELEKGMENLHGDILDTESLANTQREEITKNKEKSQQLMTQICKQFEEMHQFLRKREDEIKNELKHKEEDAAEKMRERLNAIETALSESRELEGKLTSVLEIEDSARLLKSWTECNSRMSPEHVFRPKANDLQVENISLSLGPYESHLQFFIWKEMLQVIQPRAELLSLKSNSTDITVSDDGLSLLSTPESNQAPSGYLSGLSLTIGSGQGSAFGQPAFTESGKVQSFGSATVSSLSTPFGQSAFTESRKAQSFGSGFGSGFGSTTGSGQGTLFGQRAFTKSVKAQRFGSGPCFGFGSTTGSGQSTAFGMKILPSQSVCRAQRDMASALYSQDLTCPICWTIFTDPVTLTCGHSFCRECITDVLSSQHRCPQCGTAVPTERLPTSHILKSLAEKAKEAEKVKKRKEKAEAAELCLEHEEKLKLFCVTDQQLACIICRDGDRHEGHKFKPIKEAAASLRQELEKGMKNLHGDILATESLANTQRDEITKNKEKSQQMMTQILRQFEKMHQFLRKREDEIKNELKHKEEDAVEKMRERLNAIETALSESRELEGKLTSVLKIDDSARLLKSWTECNSRMSPEHVFRPKANDLKVVNTSLSLGPYESHLQFFIWKEMLQVIQPRAELLSLKSKSTDITVSDDGRSLFSTPESNQTPSGYSSGFGSYTGSGQSSAFDWGTFTSSSKNTRVFSVNEFTSGQHYWEIEVGHRDYWELGIKDNFLKYDGKKYVTCSRNKTTKLVFGDRPRKIGIYLNCASKKLSFYDADNMTRIHAMSSPSMSMPLSAYFNIRVRAPDPNPLTVCWY